MIPLHHDEGQTSLTTDGVGFTGSKKQSHSSNKLHANSGANPTTSELQLQLQRQRCNRIERFSREKKNRFCLFSKRTRLLVALQITALTL
jgi:hypothetical protein